MFGNRRKRGQWNQPPNGSNVSPSAATAAAQAFLKNQASNASLSSAAAAAALRSRPTTPTSVADVQTKRTLRRTGSGSSMGSSTAGSASGSRMTLQRKGSTGSMTERTFRDPSPSRAVPSAPDAPPVPAIPKNVPAIPPKSHRRAASLDAPPGRVVSPAPNMATGRGSSLEPRSAAQPPKKAGQRITSLSSVQELTGIERPESRGSVNFSYPTGSRPTSPITERRLTSPSPLRANPPRITSPSNEVMIYDPNSRRFIPSPQHYTAGLDVEQRIQDAANKPVKKKKKVAPQQFAGTHLADGTAGGRLKGTSVDAMEAAAIQSPKPIEQPAPPPAPVLAPATQVEPAPATPKKKKKKEVVVNSDSESDQGSFIPTSSTDESDIQPNIQPNGFSPRTGALLAKKPSIVREDREREEEEDDTPRVKPPLAKLDTATQPTSPTPLPRSIAGQGHDRGQAAASASFAQERQQKTSSGQPSPVSPVSTPVAGRLTSNGSIRVSSISPARTTHFATTPDSLVVKHLPPSRSISPRKSALKRSTSPRGPSSAEEGGSEAGRGADSSEVSNGSALPSDEMALPRKKAVRVSFDETNIVAASAALPAVIESPVAPSPQPAKKSWFSLGRGKKKDVLDVEDDEIMKPRPALPSFGSVRGKKDNREPVEERPLVKPTQPADSSSHAVPSPPTFPTPTAEGIEFPVGQSNDHNVGAVLSQDANSKNAANISKSREPLPPQVLSVEGSGYSSDTDSSVSSQKSPMGAATETKPVEEERRAESEIGPTTIDRESQTPTPTKLTSNSDVPEIEVLQATPILEHAGRRDWPDMENMPGGWNGSSASDSESATDEPSHVVEHLPTDATTPATIGIAEPPPPEVQPGSRILGDIAAENAHAIPAIMEETEDDASVYSDAAEDLSDHDGDGFQSLNAVVESPIVAGAVPSFAVNTPPESPTLKAAKARAYKNQLSKKSSEPGPDEGWGKAQEYWKGLSAEKRRLLEQEAQDEADVSEDSDSTIEAKPAPKPRTKKQPAIQPTAEVPVYRQPTATERTYMIQPGSKPGPDGHTPVMRSSMRAEPPKQAENTQIRKSMRGPGSMRGSLRNEEGKANKSRPVSLPAPKADRAAAKTHVRNLSEASAAAASGAARRDMAPKPPPALRRKSSGDSDSSFKRARPSNERTSMRRSMRGSSVDERQQSPIHSSRFSLRSLSPTSSRPFSNVAPPAASQTHMRNSLRGSVGPTPSMRGPKPEKSSRLGFGRPFSSKQTPTPVRQRSSRFADSSDEEDVGPAFRSRFADSDDSDDDVPPSRSGGFGTGTMRANAPMNNNPNHAITDSHDLLDSDDEKKLSVGHGLKLNKNSQNGSAATTGVQGTTLAAGSLRRSGSGRDTLASPTSTTIITAGNSTRPNQSRRGSFMSILRRKKPDPASKVRKSDAESPARRDTPLERSKSDLAAVKRLDSSTSFAETPKSLKLQKKSPEWPLGVASPPRISIGENERPFTADGDGVVVGEATTNGDTARPDLGARRFTATGLGEVDVKGVGTEKKKKKFGALRKMFRLND